MTDDDSPRRRRTNMGGRYISVLPHCSEQDRCPYCGHDNSIRNLIWMGMRVCADITCRCGKKYLSDLPIGHALIHPWRLEKINGELWGNDNSRGWLGDPLKRGFFNPNHETGELNVVEYKRKSKIVLLNTVDFLYGHCLLKLLNADVILREKTGDWGLVPIIQKHLEWMLPDNISEKWIVDIPLKKGARFFPSFHHQVQKRLKGYEKVEISEARLQPTDFDISNFTRVPRHSFDEDRPYITFIVREDRIWTGKTFRKNAAPSSERRLEELELQLDAIVRFFKSIDRKRFGYRYAVAGHGSVGTLPDSIEDWRTSEFTPEIEVELCRLYSKSRAVVGVHGSSMLLPSAHAGFSVDLIPRNRWGNFGQDILLQESDPKQAIFRHRFLPIDISARQLCEITARLLTGWQSFRKHLRFTD